jgi:hypothetical protein
VRPWWIMALLVSLAVPALTGCDVDVTNTATVYPPVSGLMEVRWRLGVTGIRQVEYSLDGQVIATSSNASTSFAAQLDSTKFGNGAHTFQATAISATGQPVQRVEHLVFIQN